MSYGNTYMRNNYKMIANQNLQVNMLINQVINPYSKIGIQTSKNYFSYLFLYGN
jgi:hypothetical protein